MLAPNSFGLFRNSASVASRGRIDDKVQPSEVLLSKYRGSLGHRVEYLGLTWEIWDRLCPREDGPHALWWRKTAWNGEAGKLVRTGCQAHKRRENSRSRSVQQPLQRMEAPTVQHLPRSNSYGWMQVIVQKLLRPPLSRAIDRDSYKGKQKIFFSLLLLWVSPPVPGVVCACLVLWLIKRPEHSLPPCSTLLPRVKLPGLWRR